MTQEERSKQYLERLLKHQDLTQEKRFYAIKRIDLLIISISGAGIYIIFEMLKFFYGDNHSLPIPNLYSLKFAGCLFASAIIVNFISQWTGYFANRFEGKSTELEILKEKGDSLEESRIIALDKRVSIFNGFTSFLNVSSTLLMIGGIIVLMVFNLSIF